MAPAHKLQGRLHSTRWQLDAGSPQNATDASFYAVVPSGQPGQTGVIELKLDGLAGGEYDILANDRGVDGAAPGQSVPIAGNSVSPQYPIYLNPPALADYLAAAPSITNVQLQSAQGTACGVLALGQASPGQFSFGSNLQGVGRIICDLDKDGAYDRLLRRADLTLRTGAVAGGNAVGWDGKDNRGNDVAIGDYNCIVRVSVGELHYVAQDVETSYRGLRIYSRGLCRRAHA